MKILGFDLIEKGRKLGFLEIMFYLFLITLPLGTRVIIYQFTTGFHEYESAWIYGSDIVLFLFLLLSVKSYFLGKRSESKDYIAVSLRLCSGNISRSLIAVFLIFSFISIFFAPSIGLASYNFIRLLLLVGFAVAVGKLLSDKKVFTRTLAIIAVLAVIQSGIGFLQFKNQGALGLKALGESPISVFDGGTSKIIVDGSKVVRAYGTFPHPNILAAFLILGLISLCYFWFKLSANNESRTNKRINYEQITNPERINKPSPIRKFKNHSLFVDRSFVNSHLIRYSLITASIFIILLGLAVTFSRSAWLIAVALTLAATSYSLVAKDFRRQALKLIFILVISSLLLITILRSFILPRVQISANEPAVTQRLAYNDIGIYLIKNNPLGVGIGNQVLYSVKNGVYQKFGMDRVWQWQPIHNIYLLIGSEIGVLGLTAFLLFLVGLLISNSKFLISKKIPNPNDQNYKNSIIHNSEFIIPVIILAALSGFGFFDHFLWTIEQGRLMLWLVIGMALTLTRCNTLYYNGKHEKRN